MEQTAAAIAFGYPIAMLGSVMAGLSTEQRAQVQWHSNQLRQNLRRLHTDELSTELVNKVTMEGMRSLTELGGMIFAAVQGDEEAFVQGMVDSCRKDMAMLRGYVDATSADAAEWALHGVMQFHAAALHHASRNQEDHERFLQSVDDAALETVLRSRESGLFRAELLLFAAFEGVREKIASERVRELASAAFEHACEGIDALHEQGVCLNPLDDEPAESKVTRTLRYAAELRSTLSEDDMATLEAACMGDLR